MRSYKSNSRGRKPTHGSFTLFASDQLPARGQSGFTMIELLISLVLTSLLFSSMLVVFQAQSRINTMEVNVSETQQNARVAMTALMQDIRQAGYFVDQFNRQPIWLDASPYQLVYNANISDQFVAMHRDSAVPLSNGTLYKPGDYSAAPQEENLPEHLSRYLNESETIRLTLDTTYDGFITDEDRQAGAVNPNIYVLQKEINGNPPAILAYNVRGPRPFPDGTMPPPLFKYWGTFVTEDEFDLWGDTDDDGQLSTAEAAALIPIPVGQLPNIRQVDVRILVEADRPDHRYQGTGSTTGEAYPYRSYELRARIRARNVGINPRGLVLCGNPPSSPLNPLGYDTPNDQGGSITIEWESAQDEYTGEEDVQYYTIYRYISGGEDEVVGQVQGMGVDTTYVFEENGDLDNFNAPIDGEEYYYYIAAWDCAPQESEPSAVIGPIVSEPNGPEPPTIDDAWDTPCDTGQDITVRFIRSPQDDGLPEGVYVYYIYRGTVRDSSIVDKILVDQVAADGSSFYEYHDTPYNIAGVPPEDYQGYFYIIRAERDSIQSENSNEFGSVWCSDGLSAAKLVSVVDVAGDDGDALTLTWRRSPSEDCYPGPEHYIPHRRVKGTSTWFEVVSINTSGLDYYEFLDDNTGSGLVTGTTYEYFILTKHGEIVEDSNIEEGTPLANPPISAPTNLIAEDVACDADGDIQVAWYRSPDDGGGTYAVDAYLIYRKIDGGVYSVIDTFNATGGMNYDWIDNDINNPGNEPVLGNLYWYRITAYDADSGSLSDPTNEDDALSDGTPGAPEITAAYDTFGGGGRDVRLEFNASADDGVCSDSVDEYLIYRTTVPGTYGTAIGSVTAIDAPTYVYNDNSYNSSPPPAIEDTYFYTVRARDADIPLESQSSNEFGPIEPYGASCDCCPIFADDFESGDMGWTTGGTRDDWDLGEPNGKSFDPSLAHSGAFAWGNDLGAGYRDGQYRSYADNYLISPTMDFSGYEAGYITMSFWRWLSVERGQRDQAAVKVNVGSGWETVWQNMSNENTVDTSWMLQLIDLSQWALGQSSVRIAFTLDTNGSQQFGGWNIDDFEVCYTAPTDCDFFLYVGDSIAQNQGNNLFFEITNSSDDPVELLGMVIGWSSEGSLLKSIRTQAGGPGLVWTTGTAQPPVITAMFDTVVPFNAGETIQFKFTYQPGQMRGSALTLRFITSCGTSSEIVIMVPL